MLCLKYVVNILLGNFRLRERISMVHRVQRHADVRGEDGFLFSICRQYGDDRPRSMA